jgi:hypothetical protein
MNDGRKYSRKFLQEATVLCTHCFEYPEEIPYEQQACDRMHFYGLDAE